jgi:SAM-dependent methyltransferase
MQPAEYEIMFRAEETHWWYRALHRLIFDQLEKFLPDWREKTILDAGCGTGAILQRLGNVQRNVGVDLAAEALEFCRARGLTNVQQADVSALPFADESFDAVISASVLYHHWVSNVPAAVREMRRVLKPGGLLLVNLPAFSFLHSAHDDRVFTARRFRKPELVSLLTENGFEICRLTYWTSLLFPLAILARTFRGSKTGRDFGGGSPTSRPLDAILRSVMSAELAILRRTNFYFPFGVALLAVAKKHVPTSAFAA